MKIVANIRIAEVTVFWTSFKDSLLGFFSKIIVLKKENNSLLPKAG